MSVPRLVIYPVDSGFCPEDRQLISDALAAIEFIGEPCGEAGQHAYLIGEQFLNWITFLGCSPAIEIEPPADGSDNFCHIRLSECYDRSVLRADSAGKGPRCPHCRHEESQWQQLDYEGEYTCPGCQQVTPVSELNWRKAAVAARFFIDIYSVFPHEAVLADRVLEVLQQATSTPWQYFYVR